MSASSNPVLLFPGSFPPSTPVPPQPQPGPSIAVYRQPGSVAGTFAQRPIGIILHGSRSGQAWSIEREFDSCRNFAAAGAAGLGWNATIGPLAYSVHMSARQWGWNARSPASLIYLAVELAQATVNDPITDEMVQALGHWYEHEVIPVWGKLDLSLDSHLPMHSELPTGIADGKTDAFPRGDARADNLRHRIRALLA